MSYLDNDANYTAKYTNLVTICDCLLFIDFISEFNDVFFLK